MTAVFNIFDVLNVKPVEDPHDRILAWLCDPEAGHGIPALASLIIRRLWDYDCAEAVRAVRRPFGLSSESWPDVGVEFDSTLLLIENKIHASALRAGQIERQHELGRKRQGRAPFFHCVLCPDYLVAAIPEPSAAFRKLPYSLLAEVVESQLALCTPGARPIVEQYVDYIRRAFGPRQAPGIRMTPAEIIVGRNATRGTWDLEQVLEEARQRGGADLANAHQELYDLLVSMEAVEPRFVSSGYAEPTYQVFSTRSEVSYLLLVYASGRLFVSWQGFRDRGQVAAVARMQQVWAPWVKSPAKSTGSDTLSPLGVITPAEIAALLQATADTTSGAT